MTFDEYQNEAARTMTRRTDEEIPSAMHLAVMGQGLAGEAGEVADLLKKKLGHGKAVGLDEITSELGDVLWYMSAIAKWYGLTLDEVAAYNVAKLRKRYPNGFTHAASNARES
jgi:NTP pyrophosphatase (non-canonical NTP hydrolase)